MELIPKETFVQWMEILKTVVEQEMPGMYLLFTLYNVIARNLLETRKTSKLSHIPSITEFVTDFHRDQAKKKFKLKKTEFSKLPILKKFCENFIDWSLD
jgi:hypothetical protein